MPRTNPRRIHRTQADVDKARSEGKPPRVVQGGDHDHGTTDGLCGGVKGGSHETITYRGCRNPARICRMG